MDNTTLTPMEQFNRRIRGIVGRAGTRLRNALLDDNPPGYHLGMRETPTVEAFQQFHHRYHLSSLLTYEVYDPKTGLYWNKDTVGFMLVGAPATGLDESALASLDGLFREEQPTDAILQISLLSCADVETVLEQWSAAKFGSGDNERDEVFKLLAKNRAEYFARAKWESLYEDEPFLLRDYFLIVSYTLPNEVGQITSDREAVLQRTRQACQSVLDSSGIHCIDLKPSLFLRLVGGFLNPAQEAKHAPSYDPLIPLDQQIGKKDMRLILAAGASTLEKQGERYSLMPFHVEQYPSVWPGTGNGELIGSFTNSVQRLPCHFLMTLTVLFPDNVSQIGMVKTKSTRAIQMAGTPVAKYNTTFEERKRDWLYVLDCMDKGGAIVKGFFQINLIMKEGQERFVEEKVKSVFSNVGWKLTKTRFMPAQALQGGLPMGVSVETRKMLLKAGHFPNLLTTTCTRIAPWMAEFKGNRTPVMLFTGRRGQLLFFDPFENRQGNYNLSCCAASGRGKSFVTQEWIMSILGFGGRAYIIDSGGSYENICELLNGEYIDVGKGGLCFNPFSLCSESDREFFFHDQMPLLKSIFAEMASPDKPASAEEKAIIERAIIEAWDKKLSKATPSDVYDVLETIVAEDPTAALLAGSLRNRLRPYTRHGIYGVYFEGVNNVNLSNKFVVLELDALGPTPDLRAVVLFIIMMNITREMYLFGDKSVRKLAIIDEAWKLLGNGSAGDFIEEGFRVARKHGGSFMTITQSPADYYRSPVAKAAYDQSDFALFLGLKSETLSNCLANRYLDENTAALIRTLTTVQGKYSELLIKSPQGMFVARFVVDPITSILYATQAKDLQFIREQRKQGQSVMDSVLAIHQRNQAHQLQLKQLTEAL